MIVGVYPPAMFETYWEAAVVFLITTRGYTLFSGGGAAFTLFFRSSCLVAAEVFVLAKLRFVLLWASENWGASILRMRFCVELSRPTLDCFKDSFGCAVVKLYSSVVYFF